MPKDKSSCLRRRKSRDRSCRPYSSPELQSAPSAEKSLGEDVHAFRNDWESVVCPICMEIPHNALLLKCSSYDKGCRLYMCDTSYRHSNCFEQYLKAHFTSRKFENGQHGTEVSRIGDVLGEVASESASTEQESPRQHGSLETEAEREALQLGNFNVQRGSGPDWLGLACPLCRGNVKGFKVVKRARDVLNRKSRVCATEPCTFSGSYQELRAHARKDHPSVQPAKIDPTRHRNWVRLEQQRELGDVLSAFQASLPHATISGDYAINGEDDSVENIQRTFLSEDSHFVTAFLSFQTHGSVDSFFGERLHPPFTGVLRRRRRPGSSRQGLWGEIL